MMRNVREWTTRVMDGMDSGLLDPREIADMCLNYMSEDDVEDMCRANDLKEFLTPEEEVDF